MLEAYRSSLSWLESRKGASGQHKQASACPQFGADGELYTPPVIGMARRLLAQAHVRQSPWIMCIQNSSTGFSTMEVLKLIHFLTIEKAKAKIKTRRFEYNRRQ